MLPYYSTITVLVMFMLPVCTQAKNLPVAARMDSVTHAVEQVPEKYLTQVQHKAQQFEKRLTHRAEKAVARFAKEEQKLEQLEKNQTIIKSN